MLVLLVESWQVKHEFIYFFKVIFIIKKLKVNVTIV